MTSVVVTNTTADPPSVLNISFPMLEAYQKQCATCKLVLVLEELARYLGEAHGL